MIKIPLNTSNTIAQLKFFVNSQSYVNCPLIEGTPTFKILLLGRKIFKIQEYLPIIPNNNPDLEKLAGLTWIPTISLFPPKTEIYILALTNPSDYQKITIFFTWDLTIYQQQLTILPSVNNSHPTRRRFWDPATGKSSFINQPFYEPTDLPADTPDEQQPVKQAFTISLTTESIKENPRLESILNEGFKQQNLGIRNFYLKFIGNKTKRYFVQNHTPSKNGVTIQLGNQKISFSRIQPLSGPTFRFIYKKLSKYTGPFDWVPIITSEFSLLSCKIPDATHNKLSLLF